MEWEPSDKVIIVEGVSDKKRVQPVLNQDVEIICTNGTISQDKLDQLVEELKNVKCIFSLMLMIQARR